MKSIRPALTVTGLGLVLSIAVQGQPDPAARIPIPSGFDFPAPEATLLKLRDQGDIGGMRHHAWMVFAGMTQPAPGGEAIWETWWPMDETFRANVSPLSTSRPRPRFRTPRQFLRPRGAVGAQAIGASNLSFVLFNPRAHDFIRQNKLHLVACTG